MESVDKEKIKKATDKQLKELAKLYGVDLDVEELREL